MMEFITVATITTLAVISPGADFAMVTRNSMVIARRTGIFTACGIALGVLVHVAYSMLGIGLLISKSIVLFGFIKYAGAAYLIYLGISMMLNKPDKQGVATQQCLEISALRALRIGFLTNALNPKTTLFVVALFTQVIKPSTPVIIQLTYGMFMSIAHMVWFIVVALVFSSSTTQSFVAQARHIIDRSIGGVLVVFGAGLAFSSINRT